MAAPSARILVIDDTPANLMTLCSALDGEFELQFATSGPSGIALALNNPPDLILLDVMMPEVDGFETFRLLAAKSTLRAIPVIFVTALGDIESEVAGLTLGAADYITKPINVVTARQRIRNVVEREHLRKSVELQRDRLEAEVKLRRQTENRLRKLTVAIEHSPASVTITDVHANIEYVNPRFTEITGYSAMEAIGQNSRFLKSGLTSNATYVDMWDKLSQGLIWKGELINRRKNGEVYWEESQIAPIQDETGTVTHFVNVKNDISTRKELEQKLKETATRLATIIETEPECIKTVDEQGLLIQMNPAGLSMIEAESLGSVLGQPVVNFVVPECREAFSKMHHEVIAGNARQLVFEVIGIKGRRRWLETHAVPMREGGHTVHLAVTRDITDRKEMEDKVRQLAFHDALTNLPNRRLMMDRLGQVKSACKRNGRFAGIMFLDLDNFKPLNDAHGHAVGDLLLIEVANRLLRCVREVDTVARIGGDEFVVIATDLSAEKDESIAQVMTVAEKIRASIAEPFRLTIKRCGYSDADVEHYCTACIGAAIVSNDNTNEVDILRSADEAMYAAKETGRNQVKLYRP